MLDPFTRRKILKKGPPATATIGPISTPPSDAAGLNLHMGSSAPRRWERISRIPSLSTAAGALGRTEFKMSRVTREIFLHCHVTLAQPGLHTHAGHLIEAQVGATCELRMAVYPGEIEHVFDPEIGLELQRL